MKKTIVLTSALAACLLFSGCSSEETVSKQQYDEVVTQNSPDGWNSNRLTASELRKLMDQAANPDSPAEREAAAVTMADRSIGEVNSLKQDKTKQR